MNQGTGSRKYIKIDRTLLKRQKNPTIFAEKINTAPPTSSDSITWLEQKIVIKKLLVLYRKSINTVKRLKCLLSFVFNADLKRIRAGKIMRTNPEIGSASESNTYLIAFII